MSETVTISRDQLASRLKLSPRDMYNFDVIGLLTSVETVVREAVEEATAKERDACAKARGMTHIRWAYAENIVTIIAACATSYLISPWCFLLLMNINSAISRRGEKSA